MSDMSQAAANGSIGSSTGKLGLPVQNMLPHQPMQNQY